MNRRSAIGSMGLISTHVLFPSILAGFLAGCKSKDQEEKYKPQFFSRDELDILAQVIDIIIPATKTRSASEVGTHIFLDEIFSKCLPATDQTKLHEAFSVLSRDFRNSPDPAALISSIDEKAFSGDPSSAYFIPIKQYTMVGFFTSQEGMNKASNYVKFPGDFIGDIPLNDNTLNYGKTDLRYYL